LPVLAAIRSIIPLIIARDAGSAQGGPSTGDHAALQVESPSVPTSRVMLETPIQHEGIILLVEGGMRCSSLSFRRLSAHASNDRVPSKLLLP
jgi:hypothetical protein